METIKVFWKDKFNDAPVLINASDFDPAKHRREVDGSWPAKKSEGNKPKSEPEKKD